MMEFIIVLPIYLCLFGGLFLTGEVLLAREKLWENDRMLAWLCVFYDGDDLVEAAKSRFTILTDEGEDGWVFDEDDSTRGKEKWAGMFEPDQSDSVLVSNHYLALFSSHMALSLNTIPAWIRGPLSVVSIFSSGSDDQWRKFSLNFDQTDYETHDNARHYLFKHIGSEEDAYRRDADPATLMGEGIVWNVAGDIWPSYVENPVSSGVNTVQDYKPAEYKRVLTEFGE